MVLRIHGGNITNETSDSSRQDVHHVLDVTFVDDEAADDSRSLAAAIDCCTLVLSTTFQLLKVGGQLAPRGIGVSDSNEWGT